MNLKENKNERNIIHYFYYRVAWLFNRIPSESEKRLRLSPLRRRIYVSRPYSFADARAGRGGEVVWEEINLYKCSKIRLSITILNKMAGRKCSICSHAEVDKINSLINSGASFRGISLQFGMSDMSVGRHAENCLHLEIRALVKEKKIEKAIDHYQEISEQLEFAKELRIAAKEYLSDPETGRLILIPRAREVVVIYEDYDDRNRQGEPKKKRESLDSLLEKLEKVRQFQLELLKADIERIFDKYDDEDSEPLKEDVNELLRIYHTDYIEPTRTEIKHVDIRQFALNAISTVDTVLDKVAKVEGLYQKDKENEDELTKLKQRIEKVAEQEGTDYQSELKLFLEYFSNGVRPEIKRQLESELIH